MKMTYKTILAVLSALAFGFFCSDLCDTKTKGEVIDVD